MSRLFLFGGKKKLPLERGGRGLCKKGSAVPKARWNWTSEPAEG